MTYVKNHLPEPIPNADSQYYWEMASQENLVIRQCKKCLQKHFMPRYLCPNCWSDDLEWIKASGNGTVHTFTIIRRPALQIFKQETPYVLAMIELEEGPRMIANVVGEGALDIQINDCVKLVFETRGEYKLPQFEKA